MFPSTIVMRPVRQIFLDVICLLLMFLFVYAAVVKLLDHQRFMADLGKSPMLSPYARWISILLPVGELVIALLVVINRLRRYGLYASYFLLVLFTCYIVVVTRFSTDIPCSCGGILSDMNWNEHLVFNLFFCVMVVTGIALDHLTATGR